MSYFAEELERQMSAASVNGVQLSERTGISPSQFYNWLKDVQRSVSEEQLKSIAPALSDDVLLHAALVRAHLLDEKKGPGSELVTVEIESPRYLRDKPRPRSRAERALAYLAEERHRNPELNDLIIGLAKMLGGDL